MGTYSLGQDNIKQLAGNSCGLPDYVYVETNPLSGVLRVSPDQPVNATPGTRVRKPNEAEESPDAYLRAKMDGFGRDGCRQVTEPIPVNRTGHRQTSSAESERLSGEATSRLRPAPVSCAPSGTTCRNERSTGTFR
ncbi:arabinosyltransferase C-terminal domain-containing protein [Saccharopolyspora erythraea]|uniref:arabinosyltransferase C-terminal domain-containing protein n=1 Tax=Saccharopolyspora erythraea TaxID=1836 RepID=UPI002FC33EF9